MDYKRIIPDNVSKGGLIGGIIGAVASSKFHAENDKVIHKAAKTGIFAGLGYLLGSFLEKLAKKQ